MEPNHVSEQPEAKQQPKLADMTGKPLSERSLEPFLLLQIIDREKQERLRLMQQYDVRLRLHWLQVRELFELVNERYWTMRRLKRTRGQDWQTVRKLHEKLEKAEKHFDKLLYDIEEKQFEARGGQNSPDEW